ncbi:hypothetical protein D1159_00870 [Pseudoflavonifractor sp. 524-17]|uniref:hypothetical protein n=1 Tax=Pseudoflavonifractor sp. 524-17 TaxID=2304577 RepID=UPI00137B5572|nr:hypothetical protein [Pseudoflavonifractor sp. 524-17]NCE63165.1 hypothetical protein [Pseudoflavonifractor sp. 524-17]
MGCFTIGEILTALLVSIHLLCSGIKFLPKEKPLGIFCLSTVLLLLGAGLGNPLFKGIGGAGNIKTGPPPKRAKKEPFSSLLSIKSPGTIEFTMGYIGGKEIK